MENNIRQIVKNLKMPPCRGSDSREMSRKSSRAHSRRGSMDILEEEIPVINARFTEEDEDLILSKSGSLFGSRDELHSLSRTRSEDDLRSDDDEVSSQISRRPNSRRPSIVSLPTGRWSRRSSLAGNEFFKMDDEMIQVHRSGSIVSIPKKLSHHVPIVPIIESQDYERKVNVHYNDLNSEEFQFYKSATVEEYNLVSSVKSEVVGKQKNRFRNKSKKPSEIEMKVMQILDGKEATAENMAEILRTILTENDVEQMEIMMSELKTSLDDIVKHYLENGHLKNTSIAKIFDDKVNGKVLTENEKLNLLRLQLGPKSRELMEEMLRKGLSVEEVIKYFLLHGKSEQEEAEEFRLKIDKIDRSNLAPDTILSMFDKDLTEIEKQKLSELIQKGLNTGDILDEILKSKGQGIITTEQGNIDKSKEEVETMLRSGHSLSEVIKHFMTSNTLESQDLTGQGELDSLLSNMNDKEKELLQECLKSGGSIAEAIKLLTESREDPCKDLNTKISDVLNDTNLSIEQKFCLLKGNMNQNELNEIFYLVDRGLSVEEALKTVAEEEENESDLKKIIKGLMQGKQLEPNEILELIKEYLTDDELKICEEMIRNKYRIGDIIQYFLRFGRGRQVSEFENMMKHLLEAEGNDLTEDEKLEILRSNLGPESLQKLEEMLRSGYSKADVIKLMTRHGRTQEMEENDTKIKIGNLLANENISLEEKMNLLKEQLNEEAQYAMMELLQQGYNKEELMELFLRCTNDLSLINNDKMFKKTVRFSDEPPDAYLYEARNVWSMIDKIEVKLNVPFMTNNSKCATFACFFGKVVQVTTGQGLTHREILDLIRFRLGGAYAVEFDEMRYEGYRLQEIVDHFLMKDEANRKKSLRRARLRAQTRVDTELTLKRAECSTRWGITLNYSHSLHSGLQLIIEQVSQVGPAYRCGLRQGDRVVTVDGWLITLMDRPQVACHLFQAGCNMVRLGIMKTDSAPGDIGILGIF